MTARMCASGGVSRGLLSCAGFILLTACPAEEGMMPEQSASAQATATAEVEANTALRRLSYRGQTFLVPKEHILAQRSGKDGDFIRLRLPGSSADIVLDNFNGGKRDNAGSPIIFSVNDGPYAGIRRVERPCGVVVCRTGMAVQSGCGTRFDFAAAEVTLLFPAGKRDGVDTLIQKAIAALDRFAVPSSFQIEGDPHEAHSSSG